MLVMQVNAKVKQGSVCSILYFYYDSSFKGDDNETHGNFTATLHVCGCQQWCCYKHTV